MIMLRQLLFLCVALLVSYQVGRWHAGGAEKGYGELGQEAENPRGRAERARSETLKHIMGLLPHRYSFVLFLRAFTST